MRTPTYQKIENITPNRHCYNIYCKVIEVATESITLKNGEVLKVAKGVVGDETAVANFRVAGKYAELFKLNTVVCIRNGKSNVFDETIRLELDNFGKVTQESVQISNVNKSKNISAVKYVKQVVKK